MDPRISLVTLGVADLPRPIEFYRDFGLPMLATESDDAAFITTEGTWLARYRADLLAEEVHAGGDGDASGQSRFGGFTIAHDVDSREAVDAVLEGSAAAGAAFVQEGADREWGGYAGYFADPRRPPLGGRLEPTLRDREIAAG